MPTELEAELLAHIHETASYCQSQRIHMPRFPIEKHRLKRHGNKGKRRAKTHMPMSDAQEESLRRNIEKLEAYENEHAPFGSMNPK